VYHLGQIAVLAQALDNGEVDDKEEDAEEDDDEQ